MLKKEEIPVARIQCRETGRTASYLPIQLAPYCQYTVSTMAWVVLWACDFSKKGRNCYYQVYKQLDPDSLATTFLFYYWTNFLLDGFHRAHSYFYHRFDLSDISSKAAKRTVDLLAEVNLYFKALGMRAPPDAATVLPSIMKKYSQETSCFLFGTPSQGWMG